MAIELATAYVNLTVSAKGVTDEVHRKVVPSVTDAADKAGKQGGKKLSAGFGGGFKSLAGLAGGVFAVSKVKDFFGASMDEAKESIKVNALTATVLKSTGAAAGVSATQVGDLATEVSNYAAIDDEAVQAAENLLLTFTNVKNGVGQNNDIFNQATKTVADMSVALGTDMKGASIQVGKALNDPVKGVSALSKVGVSFTAQQKAQIKALVKSGKTMDAQKIILKELQTEFGGAAKAAATPAERAAVAWANFKESIGTALMPTLNKLMDFFSTKVVPVLVDKVLPAIVNMFKWFGDHSDTIGKVTAVLLPLLAALGTFIGILRIATAVTALYNAVLFANPLVLIIAAVIGLVVLFVVLYKKVDWFRAAVDLVWAFIKGAVLSMRDVVVGAFHAIAWVVTELPGKIARVAVGLWHGITAATSAVKDWIVARFNDVVGFLTGLPGKVAAVAARLWGGITSSAGRAKDAVVNRLQSMVDWVKGLPGKVTSALSNAFDGLVGAGKSAFNGLANAWNNTVGSFTLTIPDWVPKLGGKAFSFPKLPTLARGGALSPGWNVIGENGPELVRRAGAPARAFSNTRSTNMVGQSGPPSVNLTVNYPLPEKVSTALPHLLRSAASHLAAA
jgi:hypothetical protein